MAAAFAETAPAEAETASAEAGRTVPFAAANAVMTGQKMV